MNRKILILILFSFLFYSCEKIPNKSFNNPLDTIEANKIKSDTTITNKFGDKLNLPALVFFPDTIKSNVDEFFEIGIYALEINEDNPMVMCDILIDFDYRKIQVDSIISGIFFDSDSSSGFLPTLSDEKKAFSNTNGILQISGMTINNGNIGTGQIAKVVFRANFDGEIILSFNDDSKFFNSIISESNISFNEINDINTNFFKGTIIVEK